jgi:4-amino-4-deoxy-L-arabinose transferase-like glycosyltransferase
MDKMSKFSIKNISKLYNNIQLKLNKNNLFDFFFLLFIFLLSLIIFKDDLVGVISLIFISIFSIVLTRIYFPLRNIIILALTLRLLTIYLSSVYSLPDSTIDSIKFENMALKWSQSNFLQVISYYPGLSSYFISWPIAILYSLFGSSIVLAQSLSLFFGIGSVFLGWALAKKLWNNKIAIKVGWLIAVFPTLVLYSVLLLKEIYVVFFLLVAIFGLVSWVKANKLRWVFLTMFGFTIATFYHGAMIIGGIFFIIIVLLVSLNKFLSLAITSNRISIKNASMIILILILSIAFLSNKIHVTKIGNFKDLSFSRFSNITKHKSIGDASYPDWIQIKSPTEFIYKLPIRAFYFIFSPFPWEVKKLSHFLGMLDSFLYIFLFYLIFCNRKTIWREPALYIIFIILFCYLIIFGVGVGNFGAGIRHRVKFAILLILLAGPYIPKFTFSNKTKL